MTTFPGPAGLDRGDPGDNSAEFDRTGKCGDEALLGAFA